MKGRSEGVHLELKYCERCGGLWLRRLGTDEVYCPGCVPAMAEMAGPKRKKSTPRLKANHGIEIEGTAMHDCGGAA